MIDIEATVKAVVHQVLTNFQKHLITRNSAHVLACPCSNAAVAILFVHHLLLAYLVCRVFYLLHTLSNTFCASCLRHFGW